MHALFEFQVRALYILTCMIDHLICRYNYDMSVTDAIELFLRGIFEATFYDKGTGRTIVGKISISINSLIPFRFKENIFS